MEGEASSHSSETPTTPTSTDNSNNNTTTNTTTNNNNNNNNNTTDQQTTEEPVTPKIVHETNEESEEPLTPKWEPPITSETAKQEVAEDEEPLTPKVVRDSEPPTLSLKIDLGRLKKEDEPINEEEGGENEEESDEDNDTPSPSSKEVVKENTGKKETEEPRACGSITNLGSARLRDSIRTINGPDGLVITLRCGEHSIQGRRKTQEDAHIALKEIQPSKEVQTEQLKPEDNFAFFGVYDGHGGQMAADFVCQHLHNYLQEEKKIRNCMQESLVEAFRRVEKDFLEKAWNDRLMDGTTAVVAVLHENILTVGCVGDSEIVVCRKGQALGLCEPHNPKKNVQESSRITTEGGQLYHDRVAHPALNPAFFSIAVSRAIGDIFFKHPEYTGSKPSGLIAEPEIKQIEITPEDDFCLLACDGLWDILSHQQACDFVLKRLKETDDPKLVCQELVQEAYEQGSLDNITALLVTFKHFIN